MSSFGLYLKKERETKGVTIEEIAHSTRISRRFLEAIEQDNFSLLPHKTFAFGFLRAYAKCVGLNPDETVKIYKEQVLSPEQEEKKEEDKGNEGIEGSPEQKAVLPRPKGENRKSTATIIGLFLIVAIIVFFVKFYPVTEELSHQAKNSLTQTTSQSPLQAHQESSSSQNLNENSVSKQVKTEKTVLTQNMGNGAIVPQDGNISLAPVDTEGDIAKPQESLLLTVLATEEAWINTIIDDDKTKDIILLKGGKVQWKAQKKFIFTTGNFLGITVLLNGKPLSLPQKRGRVLKNFIITADSKTVAD